jgi:hypothetical protein
VHRSRPNLVCGALIHQGLAMISPALQESRSPRDGLAVIATHLAVSRGPPVA